MGVHGCRNQLDHHDDRGGVRNYRPTRRADYRPLDPPLTQNYVPQVGRSGRAEEDS